MNWIQRFAVAAVFTAILGPAANAADAEVNELRAQFDNIIQGLNDNSFERLHRAIDKKDMLSRIYGKRLVEPDVKKAFSSDYQLSLEQMYASSFPSSDTEIIGTVIDFQWEGNEGRAMVRFETSGYRYSYHIYDLTLGRKGRLVIVDWLDFYQGNRFSEEAGLALIMAMPGKQATRNTLENRNISEGQVFQMSELFKAVRDNKPERFFQIYDGLDEVLRLEKLVIRLNLQQSLKARDSNRVENAIATLNDMFRGDPLYSLRLVEYYIPSRQYEKAVDALLSLQKGLGVTDGVTESLKASAALAMGNTADAEEYALQATVVEPTLELAWWSLLRARTRAGDFSGATEPLARLEDDFGHNLDPQKLKRDRFLKVLADKQEYLDWRASRQ